MAIEREILQDITKYKARLIGPFTLRQAVCTAIAGVIGGITYVLMKNYFTPDFIRGVLCVVSGIPLACGYFMPYDMPLEKFAISVIRDMVIAPKIRKYKRNNGVTKFIKAETKTQRK